jgi:MoxR-like ATPase
VTDHDEVRTSLARLEEAAKSEVLERDIEIRCLIASLLARLHMAVVGPPGSGKSFMVDTVAALIDGFGTEDYFRSQVGRRTEPDDLLGSYTLESLRAGRRRRDTTRKLPNAKVAVISEFWRAPDAATDDLRSIMQEHVFYNGGDAQPAPLCTLVVESNEMPESAHALADRFTFWLVVGHLVSHANRKAMLARAAERLHAVGNT